MSYTGISDGKRTVLNYWYTIGTDHHSLITVIANRNTEKNHQSAGIKGFQDKQGIFYSINPGNKSRNRRENSDRIGESHPFRERTLSVQDKIRSKRESNNLDYSMSILVRLMYLLNIEDKDHNDDKDGMIVL
ncbi:hypothetical protein M8J77_018736 [Diaphorina citri]|nr:hypothetical protein M8J77_018736 [Diaphorina citri]